MVNSNEPNVLGVRPFLKTTCMKGEERGDLAALMCLVYHEAQNVRHPLDKRRLRREPRYKLLRSLPSDKFEAWRHLQKLRARPSRESTASGVERVYQQRFGLSLDELQELYSMTVWKDSSRGGNKWASIAAKVRELIATIDSEDTELAEQLRTTVLNMRHHTGQVEDKLRNLQESLR